MFLWTRTEPGGEGLQREVAAALRVQRIEDVLQLLCRQRQLPVEPLPGTQKHLNTAGNSKQRRPGRGQPTGTGAPVNQNSFLAGRWSASGRLGGGVQQLPVLLN